MKKLIPFLIITLLLSTQIVKAQDYDPIVDTNKLWSTGTFVYNGVVINSYFIKFTEDTLIGEHVYKKIKYSSNELMNNFGLIGFVREDLEEKQVYLRNLENIEGLVYDFDVAQGDTIYFSNPLGGNSPFQIIVDSVYYADFLGIERKVIGVSPIFYDIKDPSFPDTFIEGVGSMDGIIAVGYSLSGMVGGYSRLLCTHNNDEIIFNNPDYSSCFLTTSVNDITNENNLNIYPNPASQQINIKLEQQDNKLIRVELISPTGSVISNKTYTGNINDKIDISKLSSGIYFIKITGDKVFRSEKIVIE